MSKITAKGFTLIELLVVVSIIGLLSSIILVAVNRTRIKARDTRRFSDLQQLQKAIELYGTNKSYLNLLSGCSSCGTVNHPGFGLEIQDSAGYTETGFEGPLTTPNPFDSSLQNELSSYISKLPLPPQPYCNNAVCSPYYLAVGAPAIIGTGAYAGQCLQITNGYLLYTVLEDPNNPVTSTAPLGWGSSGYYFLYNGNVQQGPC